MDEVKFLMDFILGYYRDVRPRGHAQVRHAARDADRRATSCGIAPRAALRAALEATGQEYELKAGDGAFYGPKIDFDVTDSIGRSWQLGTIQLDYNAPERFDLTYVGEDNARAPPGRDPSGRERLVRALHRDPDRALRRRLPGLARARAGAGDPDLRRPGGCGPPADGAAHRGRHPRPPGRPERDAQLPDPRRRECGRFRTWPSWGSARPTATASRSGCAERGRSRKSCRRRRSWRGSRKKSGRGPWLRRRTVSVGAGVPAVASARQVLRSLQCGTVRSSRKGSWALTLPADPLCARHRLPSEP